MSVSPRWTRWLKTLLPLGVVAFSIAGALLASSYANGVRDTRISVLEGNQVQTRDNMMLWMKALDARLDRIEASANSTRDALAQHRVEQAEFAADLRRSLINFAKK